MKSLVAALAATGLLLACGEGGPAGPAPLGSTRRAGPPDSFPAGTGLRIVSGVTGEPVPGARVRVGSEALTSDGAGELALPIDVSAGAPVDVETDGFLLRQTRLLETSGNELSLIPTNESGLTEGFILDVLYHESLPGGSRRMMRLRPGARLAYVMPSPPILEDALAMRTVNAAVDELDAILGGDVRFAVDPDPPPGSLTFELVVDPGEPAFAGDTVAVARRRLSGWNIVGGTILYDSMESVRTSTTYHELGHMVGLGHSPSRSDVMYPYRLGRAATFATREHAAIRLLMQRPAANEYPDNDRDVRARLVVAAERTSTVRCYR